MKKGKQQKIKPLQFYLRKLGKRTSSVEQVATSLHGKARLKDHISFNLLFSQDKKTRSFLSTTYLKRLKGIMLNENKYGRLPN